ncbi:Heparanase-like protein 2 [Ananas comosus]|uniref:Heparanase-like protein 2 n=1 Tax=Ananas comosus TaxID=4615 RepID=A0A199US59_ANACO|nr:Heparanase-like protein 2 [Ananas comosus]
MGFSASFLYALFCSVISSILAEHVTVTVNAATAVAETDSNFVCATIDWWPKEKCNYGMCPWHESSLISLDLSNPILHNAIKAFKSLRIRLGGSLQDQVVYQVGKNPPKCRSFKKIKKGLFGFSQGCLTMRRWDELNHFFSKTGSVLTFGLNALTGRKRATRRGLYVGNWDPTNAHDFIEYTVSKGDNIESWEFGNELTGDTGVAARVNAWQYGKDLIKLKEIISKIYHKYDKKQPKLLAPGGFYEPRWFADMLRTSGPNVVDAVTQHIYNLGAGVDRKLIYKIQNPHYLSRIASTYRHFSATIRNFGPWSAAWVSESGGAYNSGGKEVSNTFVNMLYWSKRYLDQLGMASTFGHKVFCRQSLIGGNYGLLNTTTFVPNPDYYSALLWHKLMGPRVLKTIQNGSQFLRAYAHCSKKKARLAIQSIPYVLPIEFMFNHSSTHHFILNNSQGLLSCLSISQEKLPLKFQLPVNYQRGKEGQGKNTISLLKDAIYVVM